MRHPDSQGTVLSDCNLDQRWHITRSDSDEELIILNAYYGPAQQHVVDAENTPTHQLLGMSEEALYAWRTR